MRQNVVSMRASRARERFIARLGAPALSAGSSSFSRPGTKNKRRRHWTRAGARARELMTSAIKGETDAKRVDSFRRINKRDIYSETLSLRYRTLGETARFAQFRLLSNAKRNKGRGVRDPHLPLDCLAALLR